jgi:hypothetical protein
VLVSAGVALIVLISTIGSGPSQSPAHTKQPAPKRPPSPPSLPEHLFASDSVWNAPLPPDAPLDPSSDQLVRALDFEVSSELERGIGPWIATSIASTPLYVVPAGQPDVRVRLDNPTVSWRISLQSAFDAVPIPANAQPAAGSDAEMAVWQPSTDKLWEFFHARKLADGWHAAWGGAIQTVSQSPGYYSASAWPGAEPYWGATATSLPVIAGTMLIDELRAGSINHALALDLPAPRAGVFAWPAQRSDGTGGAGTLPEGARLRLDPNLDLSQLSLPPLTRMIAVAAQRYGLIVRDQTHHGISLFAEDSTPLGTDPYYGPHGFFGGETPLQLLAKFPWSHLQVLKLHLCVQAPCRLP